MEFLVFPGFQISLETWLTILKSHEQLQIFVWFFPVIIFFRRFVLCFSVLNVKPLVKVILLTLQMPL